MSAHGGWDRLVELGPAATMLVGTDGRIRYVSDAARRLLHTEPGAHLTSAFAAEAEATITAWLDEIAASPADHTVFTEVAVTRDKNSREGRFELFGRNLLAIAGVKAIAVQAVDVTARWEQANRLGVLAFQDAVTGLANRLLFVERLEQARRTAKATGHPLHVVMVDLDMFKQVNDGYGHQAGDDVLRAVGNRMAKELRDDATLARFGGDEFAVLLPETTEADAVAVAERLHHAITAPVALDRTAAATTLTVGACLGIASNEGAFSVDTILRNADVAMYRAKASGRDQIVVFQPNLEEAEQQRRAELAHIDELQRVNRDLARQVRVDELTGVPNLRAYRERLNLVDAEARKAGTPYSLLFCDLDHFGPYNKRWGQQVGDETLRAVATALTVACRHTDEVFRRGGEELVVLLPDTGSSDAEMMAERLREAVHRLRIPHGAADGMDTVTISIGVATLDPDRHLAPSDLEADGDRAMVIAKTGGRNRWMRAEPTAPSADRPPDG